MSRSDAPQTTSDLRSALARWFSREARDLPWRRRREAYTTWLSEIMLQQTRVDQALPFYHRFVERFPDVGALAEAPLDDVLRAWEGLGYYSRARNLHRAARIIVETHAGRLPDTHDGLLALPGIGPYTAAAIASQAFKRPHAAIDGNVTRVLSRLSAETADVATAPARRRLAALADHLLDREAPGLHNEAMMELGARVCTPTSPACTACPLATGCRAFAEGRATDFPVKRRRKAVPHHDVAVGVVRDDQDRILIQRRPDEAMLGGLWEFPGGKCAPGEAPEDACRRELFEELGIDVEPYASLGTIDHAYSHFRITLHAFECRLVGGMARTRNGEPHQWIVAESLPHYAFPRANRRLIERLTTDR